MKHACAHILPWYLARFFVVVQPLSHVWRFATPCIAAHQSSLSFTNSRSLLKLMSIESRMSSNHLVLCHCLLLPPLIFPNIRVLPNESVLHIRWPKYWSFSFSISPSKAYWGLILFRIDWFDLLAVQGTLKSLFRHHNLKASILWHLAYFMVQLSHPYMTTGKTIALTIWTFVSKLMSLLFFFFSFIYVSWRLITLQYCSGFCHTLTWISHGFTCVPHPHPPPTSLPIPSLWVFPVH